MSTGDSVPFNARSSLFFLTPGSFSRSVSRSCDVSLRRISADVQPLYPSVVIRVLSFVRFPFLAPSFSFSVGPIGPFLRLALFFSRIVYWIYLLLTGYTRKQVCHRSPFPSVFPSSSSLCLSSLRLLYLRFSPFPSFFLCFFRCCRFLGFQRYEAGRDGSEGAGINWDYFLKSYWRTRTLELLV